MCYQKFHSCHYCDNDYPCDEDNYTCPTINHDIDMDMCPLCKDKLNDKLRDIDIEDVDLMDLNFEEFLK